MGGVFDVQSGAGPSAPEPWQGKKWDLQKARKLEEFYFRQCALPTGIGFCISWRCTSARQPVREFLSHCEACKEHHGPALSRPPSFLSPPSLGNILPSVGVLFPHSHTRHQVSKSQPTLEELPLRGEVALGPGNLGLRLSFRQIWKRHFTSFSLSTLYIRRNRNSCSPTCPTA